MKKVSSRQASTSLNSCTEWSKTQFPLWVSLNHYAQGSPAPHFELFLQRSDLFFFKKESMNENLGFFHGWFSQRSEAVAAWRSAVA